MFIKMPSLLEDPFLPLRAWHLSEGCMHMCSVAWQPMLHFFGGATRSSLFSQPISLFCNPCSCLAAV